MEEIKVHDVTRESADQLRADEGKLGTLLIEIQSLQRSGDDPFWFCR
jgi:hypothetical protein